MCRNVKSIYPLASSLLLAFFFFTESSHGSIGRLHYKITSQTNQEKDKSKQDKLKKKSDSIDKKDAADLLKGKSSLDSIRRKTDLSVSFLNPGKYTRQWNSLTKKKRKQIFNLTVVGLGLLATGKIEIVGVYNQEIVVNGKKKETQLFHLIQKDLGSRRLFWSVLIDPKSSRFRVLFRTSDLWKKSNEWKSYKKPTKKKPVNKNSVIEFHP